MISNLTKINQHVKKKGYGLRTKLIIIFMLVKVIPLVLLAGVAWWQITNQGDALRDISVLDSTSALNEMAVKNIERMTTVTATEVARFLYDRDDDLLYVATMAPIEENYRLFAENTKRQVIAPSQWVLDPARELWMPTGSPVTQELGVIQSTNKENTDKESFKHRLPDPISYKSIPLYDEMSFIDLDGQELIKIHPEGSSKINYPMNSAYSDVSKPENTYVKSENYFEQLEKLKPGEIYVSDVIGAYVKSNHIGMYTPEYVERASKANNYDIEYSPEDQAFAGVENPHGRRFEGIIRWATPVADKQGRKIGYVTLALNHDHLMEFVDHITPMDERYTELSNAFTGNYAFMWDYKCRNIVHPRHHSIVGFNPETGEPEVPWLESSIYEGWKASGLEKWTDYVKDFPPFHEQSRTKKPAPELTKAGLLAIDGRWVNHAPQAIGWMDLTADGGSGSFYLLWSGLYKVITAATIPYYTGQYAPSEGNNFSKRGFGFISIGSELEFFSAPARNTEKKLVAAISDNLQRTFFQLVISTLVLTVLVIFIAIWMASFISRRITNLIKGITYFRSGERQFRFNSPLHDEFGFLADSFDDMADSIVDSVKCPLTIVSMNHKIIYMNAYSLNLTQSSLDQVVGKDYRKFSIYPSGSQYCPITALEEGREAEVIHLQSDQSFYKGIANYLLSKDGQKIGYIIESRDVTEMISRQLGMAKAMDEATQASAYKSEFLARMSHEIRTPMNAIIGLTHVVRKLMDNIDDTADEINEIKDHMRHVEASSHHLLGLLNDVLDVSKIESGKITFAHEPMELNWLIETITSIIKPRCDEKNITFTIFFNSFTPSTFLSDPLRLRQVLINLLGNAVKFTPELGAIDFHIIRQERKNGKTLLQFVVQDTGIGISSEFMAKIFQPFEQASLDITRQYGGTGLGLPISHHIIKLLGSDILIKSEVGQGSEFSFAIWLEEGEDVDAINDNLINPANKLADKRILLVDDVDLNRKVARAMIKTTGASIDEAEDGFVAVEKFNQSPINHYDLIIMDVLMPKMDGYQATKAIRALNRSDAATVPIIALTANAFTDDITKAHQSGMNAHISKPVKVDTLLDVLFKYILKV